tara:strand:- start:4995 stop:5666 length:672 start_codon:yes stop_codon:yes gene_type:complete
MSDYTKSTDFASKDALPSGNSAKIVKGTEIDTEFNNIAIAVATKADLASPGFSGSPTAPTQTTGDNTSKLATTGFVQAALGALYPVGSIYTNAAVSTNPATLLGFGTWSAFGAGRVMVGLDAGNAAFDTAQETGGSADAIVVSHTHSATSSVSDPGHNHTIGFQNNTIDQNGGTAALVKQGTSNTSTASTGISVSTSISSTGSSATNANLPPYIVVYMWRRTA